MNRIAIIGSGISGLTLAYLANRHGWHVTLFESQPVLGMDAHSIDLSLSTHDRGNHQVRIDVPPRMFNRNEWPLLTQLYELLGVASQPVDASKSFTIDGESSWLQLSANYRGGFSPAAMLSAKVRSVASDTIKLQSAVTTTSIAAMPNELTLGQYLIDEGYTDDFIFDFLFPGLASTVLTCGYQSLSNYPAKIALGSLLNQVDRSPLQRTTFGTSDVVQRLSASIEDIRLSTMIVSVRRTADEVIVVDAERNIGRFDNLVIATQANSASRVLGDNPEFADERRILDSFLYEDVPVVLHRDESFLPTKRSQRKCFNFFSTPDRSDAMCSIWLNRFYPEWPESELVLQSIRPTRLPANESIINTFTMQRPVVNLQTLKAVAELRSLTQQNRRVSFCGSYAGASVPLLESGVASAFGVARSLGISAPNELVAV